MTEEALTSRDGAAAYETTRKESRRALISSFLGSTVEYYDFLLYGAAAGLVFPVLFFPDTMDPALGAALSFVILLAGYVSRPIGGVLFGHFGDRIGRKSMLFITLMMMGTVSVCIGLMPTFDAIGVVAPLILVVLRIVQGLAVGGEWAGATLMAAEHVKEGSRGLAASIAVTGGPTGAVLATLVLGLFAGLPDEQFLSWGWRVPFLLSAVLVIIGLYLRYRVTESPDFLRARAAGEVHTGVPILRVLKKYPLSALFGILAAAGPLFMQALLAIWVVPYIAAQGRRPPAGRALHADVLVVRPHLRDPVLRLALRPLRTPTGDAHGRRDLDRTRVPDVRAVELRVVLADRARFPSRQPDHPGLDVRTHRCVPG